VWLAFSMQQQQQPPQGQQQQQQHNPKDCLGYVRLNSIQRDWLAVPSLSILTPKPPPTAAASSGP
jgi:hypothetical protein